MESIAELCLYSRMMRRYRYYAKHGSTRGSVCSFWYIVRAGNRVSTFWTGLYLWLLTLPALYHRAAVFVWRDDRWLELPNSRDAALGRSGPGFNPSGFHQVSPATGEKEAAVEGIRVEKSQRSPEERPGWWILGDTYPQRETLGSAVQQQTACLVCVMRRHE
jgi:hypothetical protein